MYQVKEIPNNTLAGFPVRAEVASLDAGIEWVRARGVEILIEVDPDDDRCANALIGEAGGVVQYSIEPKKDAVS